MLEPVYDSLKQTFDKRVESMTGTEPDHGFRPPDALGIDQVDKVINETNDAMADAAYNNNRREIQAASRQGNLLMSLARDNYSATADRMKMCRGYLLYMKRALHEGDAKDPNDTDGFLLAGIRRVEL